FKAARSIPAQKCLPLPDKTMTETSGFWSSEDKARGNSLKKASESATKHFEVDVYLVREKVYDGVINTIKVAFTDQTADLITKGHGTTQHLKLCNQLSLCNARYEKLKKETHMKISNLEECVRIKDRQHIIRANDDFIIFENLRTQVQELQSENEHLKSKVIDCKICQNLQVQVEELKSVNESLNLSVEELYKARALAEVTLKERDELVFAQCEKIRLLEEQSEPFYESVNESLNLSVEELYKACALAEVTLKERDELVFAQCDKIRLLEEQSEPFYESLKDEIKSFQIENQDPKSRESELNNLEKVYGVKESELLKDVEQMKSQVSKLLEKLRISDQEMKQQINLFEEDKRMFLAKNEFLEKVSYSMQKKYNDLLASNVVLKQRLETKFKFLKHDTSLEKMIEMIEKEYESNVSKISITSSTLENKNL
nr:ribonuclease H-like domain-containing protein [Tanacetum cinerariifolium]